MRVQDPETFPAHGADEGYQSIQEGAGSRVDANVVLLREDLRKFPDCSVPDLNNN